MALYASTRAVTKTYRHKLTSLGLTYPQFLELVVLWEHNGSTISAIGDRLMLDSGTFTPLVKRLESMRHVERRLGTRDERQVQVYATDQGMIMQARTLDVRRYVATQLGMTEEQIKSLRADLMNLIARLQESDAASRNEPGRPADHNAH